jgi:hypothetical protein
MKNLSAFVLVFLLTSIKMIAQDVINFNNGTQSVATILEVRTNEVIYKMAANPNGPVYTSNKAEINSLQFANGYREVYAVPNAYSSNANYNAYPSQTYCNPIRVVQVVNPPVLFPIQVAFGGGFGGHHNHHGGGHRGIFVFIVH